MNATLAKAALNSAVVIATLAAVTAVSLRVREIYINRRRDVPVKSVPSWRWLSGGGERTGPRSARVQIIEFADFQCPFCARAEPELEQVQAEHPVDVAVVFRNFPIPGHALAMPAARAGECAARMGKFGEFKHLLYASQDLMGRINWLGLAKAAGVNDGAAFERCLSDPVVSQAIAADVADATKLGVNSTPTFVINGLELDGYSGPPEISEAVHKALGAGAAPPHR